MLQIPALETAKTEFKGKPGANKKEAEAMAAVKALNVLAKEIKEARAAHDEMKKEKNRAKNAEWKEKKAAEKAAQESL